MQGNEEKKLSSLSKRFLSVLSILGITGYKLKQDGVINSEPTLTKIKQGKQQPSRKTISALCEAYGVNESWLHTGDGEMLVNSNVSIAPNETDGELYTENTHGAKFYAVGDDFRMEVRLVPFCAYGRFINELNTLEQDNDNWGVESFMTDKIVHGNYLAFEIKGDSMDDGTRNSFEEGDIVLTRELDRVHWKDGLRFNDHPYWVVVFDNSVLIKQIISQDLANGTITFHSINPSPEYSDFTLNMDDIRALYYVLQKKPKVIKF